MATVFLVLAAILAVLTGLTLLPHSGAKKDCLWGYRALCPFAPISSGVMLVPMLILVVLGVII